MFNLARMYLGYDLKKTGMHPCKHLKGEGKPKDSILIVKQYELQDGTYW